MVQDSNDVDEFIFYAYMNTTGKPFGMHFFNPAQKELGRGAKCFLKAELYILETKKGDEATTAFDGF